MKTCLIFLTATCILVHAQGTIGVRGPSDGVLHFLPLPVHVEFPGISSGSGFYIQHSNRLAFATARHVLFQKNGELVSTNLSLTSPSVFPTNSGFVKCSANLAILLPNKNVRGHLTHDVALVFLAELQSDGKITEKQGVTFTTKDGMQPLAASSAAIKRLNDVQIGCDVYIYGFPVSIGLRNSPRFDYSKPLVRRGLIAGTYKEQGTIIVDSSVYFGNSGGPVVQIAPNGITSWSVGIIGIVSELIPFVEVWENKAYKFSNHTLSNSGYSVVEPMDFVLELLEN